MTRVLSLSTAALSLLGAALLSTAASATDFSEGAGFGSTYGYIGPGVASLPDLDVAHPLPVAPWFPPDAVRSARRVFLHIIAETSQHAGHADILRESIDGQKTMG